MADASYRCGKCSGEMIAGYAADHGNNSAVFRTMWFDGEPEQATVFGIKGDNLKLDRTQQKIVRGLRCTRCGFLELYAV